ncbi:hypothetical protein GOB94_03405 [Granulicella sp. 5B5]|uniref:PD-(D/E)XK nuclease family protein n=1 Tax=Granulicella sp. 5B5 TaxID=1617967 RepID=UPI0015F6C7FA|nr:PD-(D/E)XK nuclease family protein [Granulicella sp. 5B5]QMV17848.1 hypothetical protein GOB94_03405 [Granulicella sp. 5B5]
MELTATRDALLDLLEAGELLLLLNAHAARELRAAYDARQRTRGLAAWQPARAISWQQWTSSLHAELILSGAETRLLLNAAQEHTLWREIIAGDPPPDALSSLDSLADLASSAYALATAWNATTRLRGTATSDDTRIFARWAEAFNTRCQRDRCLPAAALDSALTHTAALAAPPMLRMVAFPSLTPSQQQFVDTLAKRGTEIIRLQAVAASPVISHQSLVCATPHDELTSAANWLRHALESTDSPQRIAVLIPGLEAERTAFETILRETLAPELDAIGTDLSSTPWEFSSGEPLASIALIADALDLVRWALNPLPQSRISALLLSPYLNPGVEREHAAQLDHLLRRKERRLRPELSLDAFLRLLDKHDAPLTWPRQLAIELQRAGDIARPRTYAAWMEFARNLVQATGWPSSQTRPLNATEFEATRSWDSALDSIATLDFSGQRTTFSNALAALERQLQATSFQPPATHAAVQIMRPEQAEAGLFDAVLYLHATDQNLPAPERPHPLLALALQSQLHMPGTDSVDTTSRARTFLANLLQSTPTALFTYAYEDENGALRPSPLLADAGLTPAPEPPLAAPLAATVPCESVADDAPLPPLPSSEIHGGARVLQLQAACGFRAFAELRLGTAEPESPDIGFDARDSGNLVHRVLQFLWAPLGDEKKTHASLTAMSEAERRAQLERCIDSALRDISSTPEAQWDAAYLSVIRERLLSVMTQWLQQELQRAPFTVLDVERKERITVGPLELEVRLDRLDQIASVDEGGNACFANILVDYKTGGSANPKQWDPPRPEEPQLPLYTLLFGEEAPQRVKGIAFAKIIAGENMRWHGLQAEAGHLPGHKVTDLPQRISEWHDELDRLAHAFASGEADVAPKDYPKTCEHCSLQLLCRVGELHLADIGDAAEDNDE